MGCSNSASSFQLPSAGVVPRHESDNATLFVSMLSGKLLELPVSLKQDRLCDIKVRIIAELGLEPSQQLRLCFGDCQLDIDDRSLCEYGVEDQAILQVVMLDSTISDRKSLRSALTTSGLSLQHATEELRADPKLVAVAVQQDMNALQYASAELQHLSLNFTFQTLTSIPSFCLELSKLRRLQVLDLNFNSTDFGNDGADMLSESMSEMRELKELKLSMSSCNVTSIGGLGLGIGTLRTLELLYLIFFDLGLDSLDELGKGIGQLHLLKQLSLNVTGLRAYMLTDLSGFSHGLSQLANLESLLLKFGGIFSLGQLTNPPPGISSVSELGQSLAQLQALQKLHLSLEGCHLITSIAVLSRGISCMERLQELNLDLQDCNGLPPLLRQVWFSKDRLADAVFSPP